MSCPSLPTRLRNWIRDQPVRRKLELFGMAVAITATLVTSLVLLTNRLVLLRAEYLSDTLAINRMVAENAIGLVAFGDVSSATTLLATLKAKPIIRGAVIDLPEQKNFAIFGDVPAGMDQTPRGETARFTGWLLHTSAPIGDSGTGTLHLVADLHPVLWDTLRAFSLALTGGVLLALVLSHFVGIRVRRFILAPVENLHRVAHRVAERADYGDRASVLGKDEIGELTSTFNRMLDRLQANDAELRASNEGLNREIENRQRLEGQLLEASRLAGMAQVATGILHNVGNVLNSVNISANILRDSLGHNPHFALLQQTTTLLRDQGPQLATFLSDNPRGRLVPPFLIKLGEQIGQIQGDLLRETNLLTENVDHIKHIVALQQNYAHAGGVISSLAPAEIFSDALRIAQASLTRHEISVTRNFSDSPAIVTDRHHVMQIMVNLVTNAVQALKIRAPGSRWLTLGIVAGAETVEFVVEDNGVGIDPEHLQRIFQHGFTTRKDGHGFGLHSGSLAARNLGGKLVAYSAGRDSGARFTLTLPLSIKVPAQL
jgi:two-component system, NtrC family, sensor kinase